MAASVLILYRVQLKGAPSELSGKCHPKTPGKEGRSALEWAGEEKMGENGLSEENADMKSVVLVQGKEGNEGME